MSKVSEALEPWVYDFNYKGYRSKYSEGNNRDNLLSEIADIYFGPPIEKMVDEIEFEIERYIKREYDIGCYDKDYDKHFEKIENLVWTEINERERRLNAKFV
jgi:hypothetical protein